MSHSSLVSKDKNTITINNLTIIEDGFTEPGQQFGSAIAAAIEAAGRREHKAEAIRLFPVTESAMEKAIELSVFGKHLLAVRRQDRWALFHLGANGARHRLRDRCVPASVSEQELPMYLADLCDDWANPRYPRVKRLS